MPKAQVSGGGVPGGMLLEKFLKIRVSKIAISCI